LELNNTFQDSAAISVLHPQRAQYLATGIFARLKPFQHEDWNVYCDTMRNALEGARSPGDATLENSFSVPSSISTLQFGLPEHYRVLTKQNV
jgi:hypothetical protein